MTILNGRKKYGRDYDHFHAYYDDFYSKHKNEFVAIEPTGLP